METKEVKAVGKIEWFDDRFYKYELNGETLYLPSVTTKLGAAPKTFLARWRGQVGNVEADRVVREAQDRGTRIHAAVEAYQLGHEVTMVAGFCKDEKGNVMLSEQEEYHQVYKFSKIFDEYNPEVIGIEYNVFNLEEMYAGTVDGLWYMKAGKYSTGSPGKYHTIEEGNYIIDEKSGSTVDKNAFRQASAYDKADAEEIKGAFIIHTNTSSKSGYKVHYLDKEALEKHYQVFLHISSVWNDEHENFEPKKFDLPAALKQKEKDNGNTGIS